MSYIKITFNDKFKCKSKFGAQINQYSRLTDTLQVKFESELDTVVAVVQLKAERSDKSVLEMGTIILKYNSVNEVYEYTLGTQEGTSKSSWFSAYPGPVKLSFKIIDGDSIYTTDEYTLWVNASTDETNEVKMNADQYNSLIYFIQRSIEVKLSTAEEQRLYDLENKIATLEAAQNLYDIVGTYHELQNYDTSELDGNEIIKVLSDENNGNKAFLYRWNGLNWDEIGAESLPEIKNHNIYIFENTYLDDHAFATACIDRYKVTLENEIYYGKISTSKRVDSGITELNTYDCIGLIKEKNVSNVISFEAVIVKSDGKICISDGMSYQPLDWTTQYIYFPEPKEANNPVTLDFLEEKVSQLEDFAVSEASSAAESAKSSAKKYTDEKLVNYCTDSEIEEKVSNLEDFAVQEAAGAAQAAKYYCDQKTKNISGLPHLGDVSPENKNLIWLDTTNVSKSSEIESYSLMRTVIQEEKTEELIKEDESTSEVLIEEEQSETLIEENSNVDYEQLIEE